ncbi:hypothetical protein BDK92_2175 [Micromonospora pisi]|uniref:Uncharacterized protein n=1 Tax=Micromonospora pisi TaxID=589240 RepID=A0A495JHJ9_9ACTN|nr:hypothetical protein [Micromonospora pisi]RKR87874.1 hypothetical protein BDK92_2175 [Micromonospora pisi]
MTGPAVDGHAPGEPVATAAPGHGLTGIADAGAFLARLTRLDPTAVVRLRPAGPAGRTALWARLPWAVLVGRTVAGPGPADVTVSAAALLAELARGGAALPPRRDADWRWPLPPSAGELVDTMPGADVRRIAVAAAGTLRDAADHGVAGRAVGQRMLRDALLDHVAVVVTRSSPDGPPGRFEVSQRLVQAVVRMGFLGPAATPVEAAGSTPVEAVGPGSAGLIGPDGVQVRAVGRWTGLSAPFGVAWSLRASQLSITPV